MSLFGGHRIGAWAVAFAIALAGCGDGGSAAGAGDASVDGSAVDAGDDATEPECSSDDDCDSGNPCVEHETCDLATETCEAAEPLDEGATCGDGRVCDDGFCVLETPPDCTLDEQCDDGNSCNGVDYCDDETGTCQVRTCDDGDPCTKNICNTDGPCEYTFIDADGDGFAPAVECADPELQGGDCDDTKAYVNPGADEECDEHHVGRPEEVDNDCDDYDAFAPESNLSSLYFRDRDGDMYGDEEVGVPCPKEGYVRGDTSGFDHPNRELIPERRDFDCFDGPADDDVAGDVHPGAAGHYAEPYCRQGTLAGDAPDNWSCEGADEVPSFDYNCDGDETILWEEAGNGCHCGGTKFGCEEGDYCSLSSWQSSSPPDCGETATWEECSGQYDQDGNLSDCESDLPMRTQECQ